MTKAERYYRQWHKIEYTSKLTNEQWKVVNIMHACLKHNNQPKLPHGTILVNKKHLTEHLNTIQKAVNEMDSICGNNKLIPNEIGSLLAKVRNKLEFSTHSIKHFELKIELKKL